MDTVFAQNEREGKPSNPVKNLPMKHDLNFKSQNILLFLNILSDFSMNPNALNIQNPVH